MIIRNSFFLTFYCFRNDSVIPATKEQHIISDINTRLIKELFISPSTPRHGECNDGGVRTWDVGIKQLLNQLLSVEHTK